MSTRQISAVLLVGVLVTTLLLQRRQVAASPSGSPWGEQRVLVVEERGRRSFEVAGLEISTEAGSAAVVADFAWRVDGADWEALPSTGFVGDLEGDDRGPFQWGIRESDGAARVLLEPAFLEARDVWLGWRIEPSAGVALEVGTTWPGRARSMSDAVRTSTTNAAPLVPWPDGVEGAPARTREHRVASSDGVYSLTEAIRVGGSEIELRIELRPSVR